MSRLKSLILIALRYYRSLGLRVSLYALLSLLAASLSWLVQRYFAPDTKSLLDFDSVMPVLSILATSMLAVSTFSLNIMVSAHRAAAASTTPRVHRILLEDTTTQSVLSTFIGAFVYSLTSIILYQTGFYPEEAAAIVMTITILVVILVIMSMLRWIQHLTNLGSVDDSIRAVYLKARDALDELAATPTFGAQPIAQDTVMPEGALPLAAPASGYIQLVDIPHLQACLPEGGAVYLGCRPGAHVLKGQTIAWISGAVESERRGKLGRAFTIGDQRTFEQDATYGLVVLSEIASKALSPGINDAGTAIAVIHTLKKLLWTFARNQTEDMAPTAPRVFMPPPDYQELMNAAFAPIARDGAGTIEVATNLRKALTDLATSGHDALASAAHKTAAQALVQAEGAGLTDHELENLREITA